MPRYEEESLVNRRMIFKQEDFFPRHCSPENFGQSEHCNCNHIVIFSIYKNQVYLTLMISKICNRQCKSQRTGRTNPENFLFPIGTTCVHN